jgi:anti-anti-sigma factor
LGTVGAEQLQHHLDGHLEREPRAIVLDLTGVSGLEWDAVASLVRVAQRAGRADVGFYLVSADRSVEQPSVEEGLADVFDVRPSIESALRTLGGHP